MMCEVTELELGAISTNPKAVNLIDSRFERLLVVSPGPRKRSRPTWNCICDCGGSVNVISSSLVRGDTTSCGCIRREVASKTASKGLNARTHGSCHEFWYPRWNAMMGRCYKKSNSSYPRYGAIGVYVVEEWHDTNVFGKWILEEMERKGITEETFHLYHLDKDFLSDSLNVEKHYGPATCQLIPVEINCGYTTKK